MKKTEQLIIKTFLKLVKETTLDKITIQDIADVVLIETLSIITLLISIP